MKPPGPGYCHASVLSPVLLPETSVRVIWDGGAEGTSISDKCVSRILRNQSQAGIPDKSCPLRGMARMSRAQRFFSFAEGAQKVQGREVDILGELRLATADGEPLPSLTVRMVPGQIDDILVAAPDLDKLGFDSGAADVIVLHSAGLSIPRETNIPTVPILSTMVEDAVRIYLWETVMLRPHESRLVSVETNDTPTGILTGWLRVEEDDSFRVPEGPIELTSSALNVPMHNPTDDWVEFEQNKTVARVVRTSDEDGACRRRVRISFMWKISATKMLVPMLVCGRRLEVVRRSSTPDVPARRYRTSGSEDGSGGGRMRLRK